MASWSRSIFWHILHFPLIGCVGAIRHHWPLTAHLSGLVSPPFPCLHPSLASLAQPTSPFLSLGVPLRLPFVHLASKDKHTSALPPHADKISLKQGGPQSQSTALVWAVCLRQPGGRISSICLPLLFFPPSLPPSFPLAFFSLSWTGTEIDKQIVTEGKRD